MKVILQETIESLGIIGSEIKVADGYARNYLLPQKKAVLATPQNRKAMEQQRKKIDLRIAEEKGLAEGMAKRLEAVHCKITAKVADEDRLYGSITIRDIIDALAKQEVQVEKRMILLPAPIKTLGIHKVPVRVYTDVEPEVTIEVVAEEAASAA